MILIVLYLCISKSLKIIQIDSNMSEFCWIVCKNIILRIAPLLVLLYDFFSFADVSIIKMGELTLVGPWLHH